MATKKPATPAKPKQHTKAEFLKAVSDKTSMPQTDLDKALGGILGQIKKHFSQRRINCFCWIW